MNDFAIELIISNWELSGQDDGGFNNLEEHEEENGDERGGTNMHSYGTLDQRKNVAIGTSTFLLYLLEML